MGFAVAAFLLMEKEGPQRLKRRILRDRSNSFELPEPAFIMPVFFKGRKKTLDEGDLYEALDEHKSNYLGEIFYKAWDKELARKALKNKKPNLLMTIVRVFGFKLAQQGCVIFVLEIGLRAMQPLFLGGLIKYNADPNNDKRDPTAAYLYALGVILCTVLSVLMIHPYMFSIMHLGMKMRISMCSIIYRKALRLNMTALGGTTTGQVVNLITNDVGRLDSSILYIHYLWLGPIELALITWLMYREIGVAAVFGVAFMLLFLPLQAYLGKKTSALRLRTALCTDERVRLMNEIISGIQVIKMYAWEIPFGRVVSLTRKKEMSAIRKINYIRGIMFSFAMFLTRVSIFTSLVGYVLLDHFLTAEKAFMVTAFYNILRQTMTIRFPNGISRCAEAMTSIKRLQNYMMHEETEVNRESLGNDNLYGNNPNEENEHSVAIKEFCAKWNGTTAENTLHNINLDINPSTLVAVIGPVGAGKSSLLQAILGELPAQSGSLTVNGTLSYASQEPWLFTGSVRQNILFGLPMDRNRYRTVVKKCALERDFELLPQGDKTIVGERGTSLSGGQKARISLARAVYRKADIYLLDDPLSAVDTHVGRHLFDACIRNFLREDTVILVTHQLQFLEQADLVVIMDKGKISAMGTYDMMLASGLDFANLLMQPKKVKETETVDADADADKSKLLRQQISEISCQSSVISMSSLGQSIVEPQMEVRETRAEGKIESKVYREYFSASGNYLLVLISMFICVAAQTLSSTSDYYLSYWVNKNERAQNVDVETNSIKGDDAYNDIYIFSTLIVALIVLSLLRGLSFFRMAERSSRSLHNGMFRGISHASMYFFNTNPSGRILNRFSKDMGQVDEVLPLVMIDVLQIFLHLLGIMIVISVVNPLYLIPAATLGIMFYYLRSFYLKTSRAVKRVEAVTRSPIYSHLGASLIGLSTIRAFGAQEVLTTEFDNYQDLNSSAYYMFLSTTRAFGYWLDCSCVVYIIIVTLSFFFMAPQNGGEVGLVITQAVSMTGIVQWGMRQSAELENTMTVVQRVAEYHEIEPEGEFETATDKKPPPTWPEEGVVTFNELSLRYTPDPKSERVLKSLSFTINSCEKVGIVGRTGAGKSSLINALFRLSYNDGSVIIDDRDTKELGLHDLRSKISIIPQEPVLFSGTMRYNLDPFDEYSDAKLWESLDEVKLKAVVAEFPSGLQTKITEGGSNFSVGQRQLVCLARAILRENKILVMDEATANVDPQTDALIQTTIRKKFQHCTVLTIAHRLHTVIDSNKVLVMDAGCVVEFGTPYELLTASEAKIFHDMVMQMGEHTFENYLDIAQKAHEQNLKEKSK